MKKTLIAVAALASTAAFAQNVTLSGTFDPSYERVSTTTAAGAKTTSTILGNSRQGTSGVKFSGSEDLGGGLKAEFMLEQNFDATDGSNFNMTTGEVYAGLATAVGSIRLGSANSPTLSVQSGRSPFGTKPGGGYASTSGAANTRNDDSIVYTSPSFGGVTFGAGFALKTAEVKAVAADPTADPIVVGSKKVDAAAGKMDLAVNYAGGPVKLGLSNVSQSKKISQTNLMGQYNFGMGTLYAGYVTEDDKKGAANSKKKGYNVGVAVPMGAITLMANYADWDVNGGTAGDRDIVAVGGRYELSKRTSTYVRFVNDKTTGGVKVSTTLLGLQHNF